MPSEHVRIRVLVPPVPQDTEHEDQNDQLRHEHDEQGSSEFDVPYELYNDRRHYIRAFVLEYHLIN